MDRLAAVRDKFIQSLQDKARELETAVEAVKENDSPKNLRTIIHKIAGSAGFYDQSDVAELATDIDLELQAPNDAILSAELEQKIGKLIELMRNC